MRHQLARQFDMMADGSNLCKRELIVYRFRGSSPTKNVQPTTIPTDAIDDDEIAPKNNGQFSQHLNILIQ